MRHFSDLSARRLMTRLLAAVGGAALALLLFSGVAAGHAYWRGFRGLSPSACVAGCRYRGLTYYYRDGLWYCYDGGQWYYYNPCWHAWVSPGGAAVVSAESW